MENLVIDTRISYFTNAVFFDVPYDFAYGDSRRAVIRKIRRFAVKVGLKPCLPNTLSSTDFFCVTAKDLGRIREVLRYANGKAMRMTARNNYGRFNQNRVPPEV